MVLLIDDGKILVNFLYKIYIYIYIYIYMDPALLYQ